MAAVRQDLTRVSGGAHDNGSLRNRGGTPFNPIGGDGTKNLIDPTNQNGFGPTVSDRRRPGG